MRKLLFITLLLIAACAEIIDGEITSKHIMSQGRHVLEIQDRGKFLQGLHGRVYCAVDSATYETFKVGDYLQISNWSCYDNIDPFIIGH